MRKLIEMVSPLIITNEMGFTSSCDMEHLIEDEEDLDNDKTVRRVFLDDSDGDGSIEVIWTPQQSGVEMSLVNMMGRTHHFVFNKTELKIFVEMLNAALEIDLEELKEQVALRKNND